MHTEMTFRYDMWSRVIVETCLLLGLHLQNSVHKIFVHHLYCIPSQRYHTLQPIILPPLHVSCLGDFLSLMKTPSGVINICQIQYSNEEWFASVISWPRTWGRRGGDATSTINKEVPNIDGKFRTPTICDTAHTTVWSATDGAHCAPNQSASELLPSLRYNRVIRAR